MAKSRGRGRLPLPRQTKFFFTGSKTTEKKHNSFFQLFMNAYKLAKPLRVNEAVNLARYMLNTLDLGEVQTSVEYTGNGYDFLVKVSLDNATLEIQRSRATGEALAA